MQSDLENLSLQDLSDMLLNKTRELLRLVELRKPDGYAIGDLQIEIGKIQEAIKSRKIEKLNSSFSYN